MADVGPFPGRGCVVVVDWLKLYFGTEVIDSGGGPQREWVIGHFDPSGQLFITRRWGADDDGGWANDSNIAGGMGDLIFGNHIAGNQYANGVKAQFDVFVNDIYGGYSPNAQAVTNTEPYNGKRLDAAIYQYCTIVRDPVTGAFSLAQKSYP